MPPALDALAQGGVDQGFVISIARGVDLPAEPIDYRVVTAKRDGGLAGAGGTTGPRVPVWKS